MDAQAIDVSKENIQPLKQGRRTAQLAFALQAQTDQGAHQQLLKERDKYELLIRTYEGPDPLEPRCNYVQWLEQFYPKHGRESNLIPLLEDTIATFKDDPKYKQDPRFVELIVKYVETQANSLELYQLIYGLGIGTQCAILYKAWAEEMDRSNDQKRADQIFQMGINAKAQPIDLLEQAHTAFQLSVAWRYLRSDWKGEAQAPDEKHEDASQRKALGKLKKHAAQSSIRASSSNPGIVPLTVSNKAPKNVPLVVYEDENVSATGVGVSKIQIENFPKSQDTHRENTVTPGPWNNPYNKQRAATSATPSSAAKVQVYVDEEDCNVKETPLAKVPNALKPRRLDSVSTPMALFEAPDPNTIPMYCKQKVYAGGREFQLEEIRAFMYNKAYEEKKLMEECPKPNEATVNISKEKEDSLTGRQLKSKEVFNTKLPTIPENSTVMFRVLGNASDKEPNNCNKGEFNVYEDASSPVPLRSDTDCGERTKPVAKFLIFDDDGPDEECDKPTGKLSSIKIGFHGVEKVGVETSSVKLSELGFPDDQNLSVAQRSNSDSYTLLVRKPEGSTTISDKESSAFTSSKPTTTTAIKFNVFEDEPSVVGRKKAGKFQLKSDTGVFSSRSNYEEGSIIAETNKEVWKPQQTNENKRFDVFEDEVDYKTEEDFTNGKSFGGVKKKTTRFLASVPSDNECISVRSRAAIRSEVLGKSLALDSETFCREPGPEVISTEERVNPSKLKFDVFCDDEEKSGGKQPDVPLHIKKSMFPNDSRRLTNLQL